MNTVTNISLNEYMLTLNKLQQENELLQIKLNQETSKRIEEEKKNQQLSEKLHSTLNAIPDLMFEVGIDGVIYDFHSRSSHLLAAPLEHILGKKFDDLLPPNVSAVCNLALKEVEDKGYSLGHQYCLTLSHGVFWFEISASEIQHLGEEQRRFIFLCRETTARKNQELSLKESEEKFRNLIQQAYDGIFIINRQGDFLDANESGCIITGYTLEEIKKLNVADFVSAEDLVSNPIRWDDLKNGEHVFQERVIRNKNKQFIYAEVNSRLFGVDKYILVCRDITERKLQEKKIREKDLQLQKLTENISELIFQFTKRQDGSYFVPFASAGIKHIFGCLPEDVLESFEPIASVILPDDLEMVITKIEASAKNLSAFTCVFRVQIPGKDIQYILSRSKPELLPDGSVTWYGLNIDITELKKAQKKIEASEKRFKTMFHDAPLGIAMIDSHSGQIYDANPMFAKIVGRTIQEMNQINWMSITHPDDIQPDLDFMEQLIQGEVNGFQMEKRYIRPDGSIVWINMTVSHLIKEENMPVRHLCMVEDISEKKLVAENLKMLSQAVEQSPTTIVIADLNSNIEYVNPKFEETTGYSFKEVIGKNTRLLKSGHTSSSEYKLLWESILSGNNWVGEFHNKKKNGTLYWESAIISPIKNDQGIISHFLAIKEDITERKMMEEKLRKIAWKHSHEIRGPLTSILGIVAAMNIKITLEEKLIFLESLNISAKKLDAAIHSIIDETQLSSLIY